LEGQELFGGVLLISFEGVEIGLGGTSPEKRQEEKKMPEGSFFEGKFHGG
jgi:hypothetical protein